MSLPEWVDGDVLPASDVNSWFVPVAAYKPSDTTRSGTTKSDDPDLVVALEANAVYDVSLSIIYSGAVASVGLAWTFGIPSGASGNITVVGNQAGTGVVVNSAGLVHDWSAGNTDTSAWGLQIEATVNTVSAGNFRFQWASGTGGSNMTVAQNSKLIAQRIG